MNNEALRERAAWAIEYGSHASDVSEANKECEQFGRDILALLEINADLLAACMNFVWLGNNLHNIEEDPDQFRTFYQAALDDVKTAIAKVEAQP